MSTLVSFDECPEGLFLFNGALCFMSEYATLTTDRFRQRDAYVVSSGEYFWGGTSSPRDRATLMVEPVAVDEIERLRSALRRIADPTSMWSEHGEIARAALSEGPRS